MQKLIWTAAAVMTGVVVNAHFANLEKAKLTTYMAQLRSTATSPMLCQGVLVQPNFALFTRACAEYYDTASKVVVAPTQMNGRLDGGESIQVLKYHYSVNSTLDFAMVELARPSKFPPVRIMWDNVDPGKLVWLRGWLPYNNTLTTLVETTVEVLPNDKCHAKLGRPMFDYQGCSANNNIDKCSSYIFGSLVIEIGGTDFFVGTMSLYDCMGSPKLQLFNRLSAGRSFIEPFLSKGT
ncbi:hypothetical protein H257_12645 [Aphanomyces astaci]|uniref:Peptidase S1 domain-containing protein n=2 Tax=Aphanomyces astaci TaxID=112090 RepID=W4FZG8_APHAT|nr:hypothetical protein H257_12645 [Aphanomyces astaci]ETV72169.1 hypothetical protein H257_12645 [Aphanomyces astaci]|eukprot:XP_009838237.1 hypothetical protein H257_12645 [Aphanomyces astaci]